MIIKPKSALSRMTRKEKIHNRVICCHTCKKPCSDRIGSSASNCLISNVGYIEKTIHGQKWQGLLTYTYALWKPDINNENYLEDNLFEI